MSPLEEYISIILYRQQDPLPEGVYGERHHIIPRSCGGCNKKWNLVKLTRQEHYKAHELLPFIYTEGEAHAKMVYAWNQMNGRVNGKEVDAGTYARLKEEHAVLMKGNKNHLGRHHSEESKRKNAEAHKGRPGCWKGKSLSKETRRKMSDARKGRHYSEETRRKMSEARKLYWENRRKEKVA